MPESISHGQSFVDQLKQQHKERMEKVLGGKVIECSELSDLFVGKKVTVSSPGLSLEPETGVCVAIQETPGVEGFDIQLQSGTKYGFIPEKISATGVEGNLGAFNAGRRIIEIAS